MKRQNDRKELRKIHEKLRQAKIAQMLGNEEAIPEVAEKAPNMHRRQVTGRGPSPLSQ